MSDKLPSILDQAPPLPGLALDELTPDEVNQGNGRGHPCGEFSAARFAERFPDRYRLIARALAEGFALDTAARVFGIHERTAAAIREREARSLSADQYRGIQARHARGLVLAATDTLAERLRKDPDSISARDLVAVVRELHNVERSLEGAPSTIAGVIRADGASAALAELLAAAGEPGAGNRFGQAEISAREEPGAVVDVTPSGAASDAASHGCNTENPINKGISRGSVTASDTDRTTADGDDDGAATGAGGVPAQHGGPFGVDQFAPEKFQSTGEGS